MLIMKVKKVRHSQPHWHPRHNKKFVQHICTPHVLGTAIKQKYCTNSREGRAKLAKNPRTVVVAHLQGIVRRSREVRSMFRPWCNLQGLKRAVRRVTLLACSANGAPTALGLGGRGGLEGRVSGGLHQGVPRVTLLNIVMAVQGSLIPLHHKLEGQPPPPPSGQAAGARWRPLLRAPPSPSLPGTSRPGCPP